MINRLRVRSRLSLCPRWPTGTAMAGTYWTDVVSKTRAEGTEEEITIDRHRIEVRRRLSRVTARSSTAPPTAARSWASSPGTNTDYRLRVEKFSMFPDGMYRITRLYRSYGYRWLETLESNLQSNDHAVCRRLPEREEDCRLSPNCRSVELAKAADLMRFSC